jgi:RNA polymerase sigma factor (sigma-70 family)
MTRPRPPDELADLGAAAAKGNERAVRTFVLALAPHLVRVVRRVLGSSHPDVEDVTQEALFQVLEALPRYRGEASLLHFACRVAVLTAMNARRREAASKRSGSQCCTHETDEIPSEAAETDAVVEARRAMEAVRALTVTLPEAQAEALALHCVLGLDLAEISQATGAPLETVKSRLRLARRALRSRLLGASDLHGLEEVSL